MVPGELRCFSLVAVTAQGARGGFAAETADVGNVEVRHDLVLGFELIRW